MLAYYHSLSKQLYMLWSGRAAPHRILREEFVCKDRDGSRDVIRLGDDGVRRMSWRASACLAEVVGPGCGLVWKIDWR
jgi:hypothetical protein